MRSSDAAKLAMIVVAAAAVRLVTLWLGRPEFAGWLNHSYYYFVQVRSLLEGGELAYRDLPLLFEIYALGARGLRLAGLTTDGAVVSAVRVTMSLVPALLPIPVYGLARRVSGAQTLRGSQWTLVAASGFLPLTLAYLPDSQQKNLFGMLLLTGLFYASLRRLEHRTVANTLAVAALAVAIALSHFGTLAATVVFGLALAGAILVVRGPSLRSLSALGLVLAAATGAAALLRLLDPVRFERIFVYAEQSIDHSLIGSLIAGTARQGAGLALVGTVAFYSLLVALYRLWCRRGAGLSEGQGILWLTAILMSGLLVLPVVDEAVTGRLGLFLVLPALVIALYLEAHWLRSARARALLAGAVGLLTVLMAVGELVSLRVHNQGHRAVARDLEELRSSGLLEAGDLVMARTGAEHVASWFFGVDAGVVTRLSLQDFDRYEGIYVLNPLDGAGTSVAMADLSALDERSRYLAMSSNIPRPETAPIVFDAESLELFELSEPPGRWVFSKEGEWQSYGPTGAFD